MPTAFGQLVWPSQGAHQATGCRPSRLAGAGAPPTPPYIKPEKTVYYVEPQMNYGGIRIRQVLLP